MCVLGSVILDNACTPVAVELLKPDDFFDPRHAYIFAAVNRLFNAESPVDYITLSDQLTKDGVMDVITLDYLVHISNAVPSSANLRRYIAIVRDASLRRRIVKVSEDIIGLCNAGTTEAVSILDAASQMMLSLSTHVSGSFVPVNDAMQHTLSEVSLLNQNPNATKGMRVGFEDVDNRLNGLQKGALTLIAARPSMGKSAFALNIATNIALLRHSVIAIFTLEMSTSEMSMRIMSALSGVPAERLKRGDVLGSEWSLMIEAIQRLTPAHIYIDETASPNITEVRAKCHRLKSERGLDVVIIDHILLMGSVRHTDNRQQEIAEISRSLKILAKDLDVCVVAVSQLNRAADARHDKRPMLSDLRESGAIEQDADVVMLLYRDEYYNPDTEEPGVAECIIAKNRNGETGTVKLIWEKETTRFIGMAHEYM